MNSVGRHASARFFALTLFAFLLVGSVRGGTATSITGLYKTGIDGNGDGSDDHWRINGSAAYVVSNTNADGHGWYAPPSGVSWISATGSGNVLYLGRTFAYTLTFNITGSPGSNAGDAVSGVSIYMTLAVDSGAVITVNNATGVSTTGNNQSGQTQNITLSNGFVVGSNTITVTVQNDNWFYGSQGLMVSSISGVVPEVGTWIPVASALALFGWYRLRPKKKFPLAA
jgi:hypothetical protein